MPRVRPSPSSQEEDEDEHDHEDEYEGEENPRGETPRGNTDHEGGDGEGVGTTNLIYGLDVAALRAQNMSQEEVLKLINDRAAAQVSGPSGSHTLTPHEKLKMNQEVMKSAARFPALEDHPTQDQLDEYHQQVQLFLDGKKSLGMTVEDSQLMNLSAFHSKGKSKEVILQVTTALPGCNWGDVVRALDTAFGVRDKKKYFRSKWKQTQWKEGLLSDHIINFRAALAKARKLEPIAEGIAMDQFQASIRDQREVVNKLQHRADFTP